MAIIAGQGPMQTVIAVVLGGDQEAMPPQVVLEHGAQLDIVIHH